MLFCYSILVPEFETGKQVADLVESLQDKKQNQAEAKIRTARQKPRGRQIWRWLLAALAMLLLDVGIAFWVLREPKAGSASAPAPTAAATARPLVFTEGGEAPDAAATPRPVASISSGEPVPSGTGRYLAQVRPDGYQVALRSGMCYPETTELALDMKKHQCRFVSGSGSFLPDYDYGMPVPESEPVPESWYSDAVFIGNSLEQGFMLYAGLDAGDIFATQSITLFNIYFQKVVDDGEGGMLTLLEAMARRQYGKVFIMLGINEMSYATTGGFYDSYITLVDDIRELEPGAEIYLQAITPVTAEESESSSTFNNPRIHEFNDVIRQVARDRSAHYLDIYEAMADDTGCLPAGSSFDGIHPYSQYYSRWLDYLLNHTVVENRK